MSNKNAPTTDDPTNPVIGPYKSTSTNTFKFSPFEFTTTKTFESSHVPPDAPPCGCHDKDDSKDDIIEAIMKMGTLIVASMQRMQEQAADASSSSPPSSAAS